MCELVGNETLCESTAMQGLSVLLVPLLHLPHCSFELLGYSASLASKGTGGSALSSLHCLH